MAVENDKKDLAVYAAAINDISYYRFRAKPLLLINLYFFFLTDVYLSV